jgi:hypothetical protein
MTHDTYVQEDLDIVDQKYICNQAVEGPSLHLPIRYTILQTGPISSQLRRTKQPLWLSYIFVVILRPCSTIRSAEAYDSITIGYKIE